MDHDSTLRVVGAALFITAVVSVSAHDPVTTRVSWDREIAPIIQARCVGCHSPAGPAPMSLQTYTDARPWARAIREEVLARRMPKWPVVRGYGDFRNDPSLSAFEIALITAWVDGGAPQTLKRGTVKPVQTAAMPTTGDDRLQGADRLTVPCRSQALSPGRLVALEARLPAGGSLRVTLEFAAGEQEPLVWIREFDPRLSRPLELRSPLPIPDGTRLRVEGAPEDCAITLFLGK